VIDELIGEDERKRVMKSIQPVGEGLSFGDLPAEEVPAGASVGR